MRCTQVLLSTLVLAAAWPAAAQTPVPATGVADTATLSPAEREARFPRAFLRRAKGLGVILTRDEIAATGATDVDELFRTVPAIRALLPGRHVMEATASPCGRPRIYVDERRTPPGSWETNRHRASLADFIDLESIEVLEVHRSVELVAEPFLRNDIAASPEENESYLPPVGSAPPRRTIVAKVGARSPSCLRVVLIWTPKHQPPRD